MSSPPASNTGGFGQQLPTQTGAQQMGGKQMGNPMQQQGGFGQQPQVSFPVGGFGQQQQQGGFGAFGPQEAGGQMAGGPASMGGQSLMPNPSAEFAQYWGERGGFQVRPPQMGGQQPQMGPDRQRQFGQQQQAAYDEHRGLDLFGQQPQMGGQQQDLLQQFSQAQRPMDRAQLVNQYMQQIRQQQPFDFNQYMNQRPSDAQQLGQVARQQAEQRMQQSRAEYAPTQMRNRQQIDSMQRQLGGSPRDSGTGTALPTKQVMPPSRPNTQQVRPEDARMQSMRGIQQLASRSGRFG
jgi:hypothetical protein